MKIVLKKENNTLLKIEYTNPDLEDQIGLIVHWVKYRKKWSNKYSYQPRTSSMKYYSLDPQQYQHKEHPSASVQKESIAVISHKKSSNFHQRDAI